MSVSIIGVDGATIATTANPVPIGLPAAIGSSGFAKLGDGVNPVKVSYQGKMGTGRDTLLFHQMFSPISQNTAIWKHLFTTMTAAQSAGYLNFNTNATTTISTGCSLQSWKYFPLIDLTQSYLTFNLQLTAALISGQEVHSGLFIPSATARPTEGVYFRFTSTNYYGVINYNGVETTVTLGTTIASVINIDFQIIIDEKFANFYNNGTLIGSVACPVTNANIFLSESLPIGLQMHNQSTPASAAPQAKFSCISVYQFDIDMAKAWSEQQSGNGNAYQGLGGGTMGSLASYSNAALGAAAALTNTTALLTGLGGVGLVLPTLAAGTDGILCSYQNPAGSITQPARTLVVKGITISAGVQTVLAGGPLNMVFGAAFGHTSVSLATAETGSFITNTTKAPRRVPIGVLNSLVTAAAGADMGERKVVFASPIYVNPGEFFAITCRNVGTVTTTGALVISAAVDHYFE